MELVGADSVALQGHGSEGGRAGAGVMQLACNSYSVRTLPRAAALAELGRHAFHDVELWAGHAPYRSFTVRPGDVLRDAAVAGVRLRAYCIGGLFGLVRGEVCERISRAVSFARALGVDLVTAIVDPDVVPWLDALALQTGTRLALENHWYVAMARPEDCAAALAGCSPAIGLTIDTGHFAMLGCRLGAVARMLAPRTLHVHVKAIRGCGPLARSWRRWRRRYRLDPAPPGPYDQLDGFLHALHAGGYRGLLAVEHEADPTGTDVLSAYRVRLEHIVSGLAADEVRAHA